MTKRPTIQTAALLLMFVAGLLTADIAGRIHLMASANAAPAAGGGIPDSGAQLQAIVDGIKTQTARLDSIQAVLESGKMTVLTKPVDEKQ
jgi:hypothetical protein